MTMLPHLGQARILPIADWSRTRSLAWQVVQTIENNSTRPRARWRTDGQPQSEKSVEAGDTPNIGQLYHSTSRLYHIRTAYRNEKRWVLGRLKGLGRPSHLDACESIKMTRAERALAAYTTCVRRRLEW
jgi:hypothetical protein